MKVVTPQVSWHNQSPVWSVDFSSEGNRLVTAGGDNEGNIWRLPNIQTILEREASLKARMEKKRMKKEKNGINGAIGKEGFEIAGSVEWLGSLSGSGASMNIARFAPGGRRIATGADGGEIVVYELEDRSGMPARETNGISGDSEATEKWTVQSTLRGHLEDVLDLAWSGDGNKLVSGSVDNTIFVWSVGRKNNGKCLATLKDHHNYVQGVAFDYIGGWIASQSTDRSLKIYRPTRKSSATSGYSCTWTVAGGPGEEKKLFLNDAKLKGFFRRLEWSPDGSFLACPAGIHPGTSHYAVHIFARDRLTWPAAICSGLKKPAAVVRFSPVRYLMRNPTNSSSRSKNSKNQCFSNFSYRMVFAVATADAILIYETQFCRRPIIYISGVHYEPLTDLAWSADGRTLLACSIDGYVSVIGFDDGELGTPIPGDKKRENLSNENQSHRIPVLPQAGLRRSCKKDSSTVLGKRTPCIGNSLQHPLENSKEALPIMVAPRRKVELSDEPGRKVMKT